MIVVNARSLKKMRIAMGLTQFSLGKLVGLSDQMIARYEKGQSDISGAVKVLVWLLFDEQINKNKYAVRDYLKSQ